MTALGSCETIILDLRPFLSPTKGTKSSLFRKSCGRGGETGDGCLGDQNAEVSRGSTGRFSSCYGQDSTQEDIYDNDVKPLLDVLYEGVVSASMRFVPSGRTLTVAFTTHKTVTIFAYGVTSSGKTHTMQGSPTQPGIIPRVMHVRIITDSMASRQ